MKNIQESIKKNVSGDEGGILAALWRSILINDKFLPVIDFLVKDYARKNKGKKAKNPNTILGLVTAPRMTWKSFIFLITKILPVKRFHVTIELEYLSGKKGIHSISIPVVNKENKEDIEFAEAVDTLSDNIYRITKEDKGKKDENNTDESTK